MRSDEQFQRKIRSGCGAEAGFVWSPYLNCVEVVFMQACAVSKSAPESAPLLVLGTSLAVFIKDIVSYISLDRGFLLPGSYGNHICAGFDRGDGDIVIADVLPDQNHPASPVKAGYLDALCLVLDGDIVHAAAVFDKDYRPPSAYFNYLGIKTFC